MASRLLAGCSRLLSRAPPQAMVAASKWSNPISVSALQRAPTRLWVPERSLSDGSNIAMNESVLPMSRKTHLDKLLAKAATPEDILQAWKICGGNGNAAGNALVQMSRMVHEAQGSISSANVYNLDPRLDNLMNTIHKEVATMWNSTLLSVLQSFWVMDLSTSPSVLTTIQAEVLWRVRRLNCRQLALLVDQGLERTASTEVAIVNAALKQLELRWTEISDAKTVTVLLSKGQHISPTLMDRLEDKVLELAESFTAQEIRRVCLSMAYLGRRSLPLLRALSYHLIQKPSSDLTTPLLVDMTFVYGKLKFHNSPVFQRIAVELLPRVPEFSPAEVASCAKCLGFLKWLHPPLFEAFAAHYIANSENYNTGQLCTLINHFAWLGFQPSKGEQFYSKVHSALEGSLHNLEPFLLVEVLWSLCVLQQIKPHYCQSLASHKHEAILSGDTTQARVVTYRLKRLQIATTLRLDYPGSTEADTAQSSLANLVLTSVATSPLQKSLRESLQGLVKGRPGALRIPVNTIYGWTLDAEVVVDSENQLLDLLPLSSPHLLGGGGEQALPAGARRLVFIAWDYSRFGLQSRKLMGRHEMMKRHLKLANLILVEVPYYEWSELKVEQQRVVYLKDKMGKAVGEAMVE